MFKRQKNLVGRLSIINRSGTSLLEISRTSLIDSGLYRAEITNSMGRTSYYCMLKVTRPTAPLFYKHISCTPRQEYTFREGDIIRIVNKLDTHIHNGKLTY